MRSFAGPVSRFSIDLPADQLIVPWYGNNLAFSPDGQKLAYIARQNGKLRLFLRELKNNTSEPVPNSDDASAPFFAPDGRSVAVYRPGEIRRYFLAGNSQRLVGIAPLFGLFGAVWDPEQGIFFNDALASAGNPASSVIYHFDPRSGIQAQPAPWTPRVQPPSEARMIQQVLPGGDAYLFSVHGKARSIGAISVRDGSTRILIEEAKGGLYIPTGHLVFWRSGNLMIAPMSLARLELLGPPAPVVNGVGDSGWQGPDIAVSPGGTLAYVPRAAMMPDRRLLWVDLSGHATPVPVPPGPLDPLDISRDGKKLSLARFNPVNQKWSLWNYRLTDGSSEQLSPESTERITACWSADGRQVIYSWTQDGGTAADLYRKFADGTGVPERLSELARSGNFPQTVSADGRWVIYLNGMQPDTKSDIWAMPLSGGKPRPLVRTTDFDMNPSISPDGKWLAYVSQLAGLPNVYVRSFDNGTPPVLVSDGSGAGPLWDPGGRKLYYRRGLNMMLVPFDPATGSAGRSERLFSGDYMYPAIWTRNGLLSPDGKRFLLLHEELDPSEGHRINIVVNWFSEVSGLFRMKGSYER